MKKHVRLAAALLVITASFMLIGIVKQFKHTQTLSKGNYFFQNTRDNAYITKIKISLPSGKNITLFLQDGLWKVEEADNYYASLTQINRLIKTIQDTIIFRADYVSQEQLQKYMASSMRIESYDKNGNIIDTAYIAPQTEHNKYYYATLNNNGFLYQLSGKISLSPYFMDWVHMPILQIAASQIKRIKSDNFTVYRTFEGDSFKSAVTKHSVPQISKLINNLWYLGASDIKYKSNIDMTQFQNIQNYEITLFNGIIYNLRLYKNEANYWIYVDLQKELLFSNEAVSLLQENQILYNGWYFKLDPEIGEIITNFILE